jgi:hypothetical protein
MERTGLGPLPAHQTPTLPGWAKYRRAVIGGLVAVDKRRFAYLDENTILGACPLCLDGTVRVFFHGVAPRADLVCSLGCDELEIANVVRPRGSVVTKATDVHSRRRGAE